MELAKQDEQLAAQALELQERRDYPALRAEVQLAQQKYAALEDQHQSTMRELRAQLTKQTKLAQLAEAADLGAHKQQLECEALQAQLRQATGALEAANKRLKDIDA